MMGTRKGLIRLVAMVGALTLVAAGCSDDNGGVVSGGDNTDGGDSTVGQSVDGVFKIGSVLPQTGDLAQYGPGMEAGVSIAIDEINAAGGVLGKPVEWVKADEGLDDTATAQATERLVGTEKVDAIIGAAGSTDSLKGVVPKVVQGGRLACSPSNTSPALTTVDDDGWYFRTAPSDKFQSQLLTEKITGDSRESVAIINRADDYGQAFADLTKKNLEDAGVDVPEFIAIDPKGGNYDSEAQKVAAAAPDALVLIAFPEEGAPLFDALIKAGVGPADVPTYITDGLASDDLAKTVDPNNPAVLDGITGTRPGAGADTTEFDTKLKEEKGVETTTFAAGSYDCTVMFALGALQAGTDDPKKIQEAMVDVTSGGEKCSNFTDCAALIEAGTDIDYDGLTGFDLDDVGEPAQGSYEYFTIEGGKLSVKETTIVKSEGDA